jgi:hypothetical protein
MEAIFDLLSRQISVGAGTRGRDRRGDCASGQPSADRREVAVFKKEFANFSDLRSFVQLGGQKGVQRPVLPPGSLVPIHPLGFLILTRSRVYGVPVSPELRAKMGRGAELMPASFGLKPDQLELVRIEPQPRGKDGTTLDIVSIVTTYEGDPLPSGDLASRLGGYADIEKLEAPGGNNSDAQIIEALLGSKNQLHNNYQDYQAFLDHGGHIGMQHDPLLYGAYALNPFLVGVEFVPMMVVKQGQVAVVKAYVGLATQDTSGAEFKYGSLVRPGHRGVWQEPLRTGKYPLNPRCYESEIVPTAILNLNWADAVSEAHNLDAQLQQIVAKSKEGFVFKIDLQVQIHVSDTKAPRVISMVGTMKNLVNEVRRRRWATTSATLCRACRRSALSKRVNKCRWKRSNIFASSWSNTRWRPKVCTSRTLFCRKTW